MSPEQNIRLGYWFRQKLQSEQEDYISLLYEQSGGINLHKTEQTCRLNTDVTIKCFFASYSKLNQLKDLSTGTQIETFLLSCTKHACTLLA